MMNKVLRPVKARYGEDVQGYMDDILIATKRDTQYHREVVWAVLLALKEVSLFLKPKKCKFEKDKVEYLRLLLDSNTIKPNPSKVSGLKMWPTTLKNIREVWETLEILNFNHTFIKRFAHIAKPLIELLKKNLPFKWTDWQMQALEQLIKKVTTQPVLVHPDPKKLFELEVDTSDYATGAILFQRNNKGKARPIGYHSKTFSDTEQWYNIYDKELTAIDRGLENWWHLLLDSPITVHTDHSNLTYYWHPHKLTDHAWCAITQIMWYNLHIKHKPGIHNRADALSCHLDYAKQIQPEEEIGLSEHLFIHDISALDLDDAIHNAQTRNLDTITQLLDHHPLTKTTKGWTVMGCLIVVGNNELWRGVIFLYHDFPTTGLRIFAGWPTCTGHRYRLLWAQVWVGNFPPTKNLYLWGRLHGLAWVFFFRFFHHRCRL